MEKEEYYMHYATPTLKINHLITEFNNFHNSKGSQSFFRNSPESYYLYLLIMDSHYNKNPICVESLINLVCPKYCSRQTVKNIIASALDRLYITKSIDEKDHRRKLFAPTLETIEEFESWINQSFDNS